MIDLSAENLLGQYRTSKGIEIERLLEQYGTSLKDVREMYPQLTETIKQRQLTTAFSDQPLFFTPSEALDMGLQLQEGWMLKMTPAGEGYSTSLITPEKWEITENDMYISPTGEEYTKADLQALLSPPTGGLATEQPLTIENLTEEGQRLYEEYQQAGGALDVAGWYQERENEQLETEQVFGKVFPTQSLDEILNYIDTNPEGFLADIRAIGRTADTEALIKSLEFEDEAGNVRHLTDTEIEELFTVAGAPEYIPENWFKDNIIDPLYAGAVSFVHGLKAMTSLIHGATAKIATTLQSLAGFGQITVPPLAQDAEREFLRLTAENNAWIAEHPELTPNPLFSENPFEHLELFRNPGYIAYSITSSLAYSLSVMGTLIGVTAAAGPVAGFSAAMLMAGGPEATSMTEELVKQGVPFEDAAKWGSLYGLTAGGIETVSDLPFVGLIFKPIGQVVKPMWNSIFKGVASNLAKKILTGLTIPQIEGLEEVVTQVVHNAILKHYDETQSILEGVSQAYIQATIASLPFGAVGGMASYRTFRNNLSPEVGGKLDDLVNKFQTQGLDEAQAQVQAVNELARDSIIEVELSGAIEAAQEEYYEEHPEVSRPTLEPTIPTLPESILQDIKVAEEMARKVTPITSEISTGQSYTATVFRGYKPGVVPTDEGLFGKGTYYTTNKEYAETYDGKEVMQITLKNPFVINTQAEAEAFWNEHTRPIRQQALNEGKTVQETDELAACAAREWLESQGYDGLIARNIIEKGDEIVVFEPQKTVGPKVPVTEAGMPEAGLQPSMLEEVPAKEVRPEAAGKLVQARLDDYLRLREYNKKAVADRIAEIKKALEKKGRTELGLRGTLALELARLEAQQELDAVKSIEDLDALIKEVETELGLRSLPFQGQGGKSHIDLIRHPTQRLFKGYTTRQLDEMLNVYQQARQTMQPEVPAVSSVKAEDISADVPALTNTQLTSEQVQKTLALFKDAVAAPNAQIQRAAALELRKHIFAQRAASAHESAQAMIAEGMNPEEAIKAAEQMFMSGKLPDLTTDYFDDLTQEMRNILFAKVYNYWKDKSWPELISTSEALTNALAGKSIPRVKGIGTRYFPDGGSAWDRLARVFVGDIEILEALDKQLPLPKIIEGVFLQTGRGEVALTQDTIDWLKSLSTISEEDKTLLTKPLSEITEVDIKRIAEGWFWQRKRELDTLLKDGVITRGEYALELAIAKDRVFPYKVISPQVSYPGKIVGQARLGEKYVPPIPLEETRTEAELRLKKQAMEAEAKLAEARAKRLKEPFQLVVIDPVVNSAFEQAPMFTLRERQTISRVLKALGWAVVDINNLLRGGMASFDASWPRQGKYLMQGHPAIGYKMWISFFKSFNTAEAEAMQQRIMQDPLMELYEDIRKEYGYDFLRIMGVQKGTAQWRAAEEYGYPTSERLLPRVTQKVTAPFERIFVSPLNVGTWTLYKDKYRALMRYAEKVASGKVKLREGESVNIREEMATYQMQIGNLVQRASLGQYNKLGPILNTIFFAARSKLGRFFFPLGLTGIYRRGGEWHFSRGLMKETWRDFMITNAEIAGVVVLGGFFGWWDYEKDPRNAEFMSIRIGNLRIDPWAGYRQFLVLYTRLATGTGVSSVTGAEYESDPIKTLWNFLRSSLAPVPGILLDFWTGRNFLGAVVELTNAKQWLQRIAPFATQDIWEAFDEGTREGLIAIIPALFGEGVQTYTGDWRENWQKIGLPKYPENTGYGIYEPIYDVADFWADTASQFRGVDPSEITEAKGFPPYVRSIVQALQIIDQIELLPNKKLASINADPEQGTTFIQYYQMWQERQRIVASGDTEKLKAFDSDERTRNAYLGNMTQAQYALLVEYHSLPEDEKAEFLGKHPELYINPREDWLRTHPKENALLTLWGKADVYSIDALNQVSTLSQSLGIPENALIMKDLDAVTELKLKNQHLFDLLEAYGGLDDTFKGPDGLTARDRAIQQLYLDNPDFRDDERRIEALEVGTETNPTPESIVQGWVERGQIADDFGASSAEMKLWLIDNKEVHQWALDNALLSDTGEDWNENILRLQVSYREDFDKYDAYGNIASPLYISNDTARAQAREAMLFDNNKMTSFGVAHYTIDALQKNIPENLVPTYVEYFGIRKREGVDYEAGWYEDDWYLLEHSQFYKTMITLGEWQGRDFSKVPTRGIYDLYKAYRGLVEGDPRKQFRIQHPELDAWLVYTKGYSYASDAAKSVRPEDYLAYLAIPLEEDLAEPRDTLLTNIQNFLADNKVDEFEYGTWGYCETFAKALVDEAYKQHIPIGYAQITFAEPAFNFNEVTGITRQILMQFIKEAGLQDRSGSWGFSNQYDVWLTFLENHPDYKANIHFPDSSMISVTYDTGHALCWFELNGVYYYIEPQSDRVMTYDQLSQGWESHGGVKPDIERWPIGITP